MRAYVISKVGDEFELPCGVFDTAREVADYIGCSVGHVWNSFSWRIVESDYGVVIGDYVVELVDI